MPPAKGGNSKKEAGRAKKEENENKKKSAASAKAEAAEAEEWSKGAKDGSKADKAKEKAAEAERKKAEKARLLAEEEASLPSKPVAKGGAKKSGDKKKDVRPAGPGAIAAGGGLGSSATGSGSSTPDVKKTGFEPEPEVHIKATGLDNMLEALEIVNAKGDKANIGAQAGLIEKHPERRFKAAFEAYLEREMPELKKSHPGLRKQQMHDMLYKQFQKAPENPFNQVSVAYNATKDEKVSALKESRAERERAFAGSPAT